MTRAVPTDAEPTASGPRPGGRWHAVLGLLAVVLAYVGLALGTPPPAPSASTPTSGLSTVEGGAHRSHVAPREPVRAVARARSIDPPRADRPTGSAVLDAARPISPSGAIGTVFLRPGDAVRTAAPRAFFPRGPPVEAV